MKKSIAALVVLLGLATPALGAEQFDLRCDGWRSYNGGPDEPVETVYRIDLAKMLYCQGECSSQLPIKRADAAVIVFEADLHPPAGGSLVVHEIDRTNGEWTSSTVGRGGYLKTRGNCVAETFKPFPVVKSLF